MAPNAERGVFRSNDGGADLEEDPLSATIAPAPSISAIDPQQSAGSVRGHLGRLSHSVDAVERRSRQRTFQIHRRRRPLDGDHAQSRHCRRELSARSASPFRAPTPIASTRSSKPTTAACSAPTTPAPPGNWSTTTAASGSARSTTRASPPTRKAKDTVYVLNTGLLPSTDGGKTFARCATPHGDHHDLWIAPTNPQRMIDSNDGGANVSTNGGQTWTGQEYPTAQLYHVATTGDVPVSRLRRAAGQLRPCASPATARRTLAERGGTRRDSVRRGRRRERLHRADPKNANIFYAGSQGALLTRYDRRTGDTRDIQVYPLFFSGDAAGSLKERWQWTFPIVFSPVDPNILYTSSQHLWKTTTTASSWAADQSGPDARRSEDARRFRRPDHQGSERPGNLRHYFHHRALAQRREHHLDRLRRRPGLHHPRRRQDTGPRSRRPACRDFSRISLIDASPYNPAAAYVAAKHYQIDDRQPYIFKTDDYGKTWTKIVNGIPDERFRARRSRRSGARGTAVRRHRTRHLRFVRRWRALAVAAR